MSPKPPSPLNTTLHNIPVRVERGQWWWQCPFCGADWADGQLWIDRGGPPCLHLKVYMRVQPDGCYLQFMMLDPWGSWKRKLRRWRDVVSAALRTW